MNPENHGDGPGRSKMSRLQWEQHLEDELAARKYQIALYEAGNIQRALAKSRQQSADRAAQQQAPHQTLPTQSPTAGSANQQTRQPGMQQQGTLRPIPHGLPLNQPFQFPQWNPDAEKPAHNHIDLTSLSDVEDSKPASIDNPALETPLVPQGVQPREDNPAPDVSISQRQPKYRLGMQLDNQHALSEILPVAAEPPIQTQAQTKPTQADRKPALNYEPPYKEHPTIVRDPDSDDFVELRCPICGGNASIQHNLHGQLKHFTGAIGVRSHYRICHPSKIDEGEVLTLVDMVRKSTFRKLSAEEVDDMLAKKAGTYAIGHFRAAASEPNARIRGPREQKPQKRQSGVLKNGQVWKRSRVNNASRKASSRGQPVKTCLRSIGNDFIYDLAGVQVDEDDEDDDLLRKKHARIS